MATGDSKRPWEQQLRDAAAHLETDVKNVVKYLNDEVVPEVGGAPVRHARDPLGHLAGVGGLRIGEAVGLTWETLDLGDQPKVKVREQVYRGKRKRLKSKDGKRDIPLPGSIAEKLLAHRRDAYASPKAPVFGTTMGSFSPLSVSAMRGLP